MSQINKQIIEDTMYITELPIDQSEGYYKNDDIPCCVGARLAGYFETENRNYHEGIDEFAKRLGGNRAQVILMLRAAGAGHDPMSVNEWLVSPKKVWQKLLEIEELPSLKNSDLRGADLRNTDLRDADLSGANLHHANLYNANLYNANLHNTNLRGVCFSGADLRNTDFSDANMHCADLSHANLSGTDLSGANLYDANLSDADLSHANLSTDLSVVNLSAAILGDIEV